MEDKLSIGNVEVQSLTDAEASMPFPLEMLFPNAPAEAWEEFKQRYPEGFDANEAPTSTSAAT